MTAAIVNEISTNWDVETETLMCPPDYMTRQCLAMALHDQDFDRLECLIANGGNPNDTTVINCLLDKQSYSSKHFLGRRRIIELETYNRLRSLGCEMKEEYFVSVDREDNRTSVNLFKARKVKSRLDSGVAFCAIEEVQDRIKNDISKTVIWHNNRFIMHGDLTVKDEMEILTNWLGFDILITEMAFNLLCALCVKINKNKLRVSSISNITM